MKESVWNLLEKLNAYQPVNQRDIEHKEQMIVFFLRAPRCFERTLLEGHFTGSAWLCDPTQTKVLLTHHKKLDMWLQLGGHADGNPNLMSVALREAEEESGISSLTVVSEEIFDIDIHTIPARPGEPEHLHYDVRFLIQAAHTDFACSKESKALAWVHIRTLEQIVSSESLLGMQKKFIKLGHFV